MAIDVTCPQCQTVLEAPDELAGKKGKCPQCMNVVDIPQNEPSGGPAAPEAQTAPDDDASTPEAEAAPADDQPKGEEAKPKKLLSKCPECGQQFAYSEAKKGATINCPKCKKQMTLPT